jgi:acid phosphatase
MLAPALFAALSAFACTRPPAPSSLGAVPPPPQKTDVTGVASRGAPATARQAAATEGTPLSFVFVGDTGTASSAEQRVADAIAANCRAAGCDFMLHLGDIIYPNGIGSAEDPLLASHLEQPYASLGVPMFLTLGNHDYRGSPDAWIEAFEPAARKARGSALDARIPARYYTFLSGEVRFVALDTNRLDAAQGRWLDAVLLESRRAGERWIVVFGHHPWVSYGWHGHAKPGDAAFYARHLCNRVDFFLTGHEHDKQILDPHCGVHLVVSGAGSMQRPARQGPRSRFAVDSLGFGRLSMHGDVAELTLHGADGAVEYHRRIERRPAALGREADGLCAGRTDDPDCEGIVCVADDRCVAACASDPDCMPSAPTPCPCDAHPAVCERVDATHLCGCDAACTAGVPACVSDGYCDRRCPQDVDCTAAP